MTDTALASDSRRGDAGTPALEVRGVRKTFEAENAPVRALRGVSLRVGTGQFLALMGPSGCGKSTLLNLVAGLDTADEGTISVAGETVTGRSEDELALMRRQHIGIVFQFFNLLEGMTALENVALPAIIAGTKRRPAETRARDLLDLLGLADKARAVPGVLSGGQRQRLALGRALIADPAVLLLDVCTSALDAETESRVRRALAALRPGRTTVVVSDKAASLRHAVLIVVLDDGRIIERGSHRELMDLGGSYARAYRQQALHLAPILFGAAGPEPRERIAYQPATDEPAALSA